MLVDFNREIDFNGGAKASTFFSEDCVAEVGAIAFKGREGAKKYYADRLESFRALKDGIRTTRHTVANLQITAYTTNVANVELAKDFSADPRAKICQARPTKCLYPRCHQP
jgi:hypothetical protein